MSGFPRWIRRDPDAQCVLTMPNLRDVLTAPADADFAGDADLGLPSKPTTAQAVERARSSGAALANRARIVMRDGGRVSGTGGEHFARA